MKESQEEEHEYIYSFCLSMNVRALQPKDLCQLQRPPSKALRSKLSNLFAANERYSG